ncbi:MAG: hypothetical protein HY820_06250 [Acidobacteria bacterium]|nr:hypothetical protein [Acidobacteriota bacterium]
MNNQLTNNPFGTKVIIAAALLVSAATLVRADDQPAVLTLGYANSPLLQTIKANRTPVDARAALKSRDRKSGVRLTRTELRNVDVLVVDLAEIETTPEDLELVDSVKEAGIPMVLENVTAPKMAALFGFGVDNSAVVVEYDPKTRRGKMNLADPMKMDEVPGYVQMPYANANFGDRVKFVQEIVRKRPFARGARVQSALGNCINTSGTKVFSNDSCKEWEIEEPAVYFCPAKANVLAYFSGAMGSTVNFRVGPAIYSCAWATTYVDAKWQVGIYKVHTSSGAKRYVVVRNTGGWGVVGPGGVGDPRTINTDHEKFPFFSMYRVTMLPVGMPSGWQLDKAFPANVNSVGSIQTTTGWTVSAGGNIGVQPDGGTGSIEASVSYERSRSTSISVSDWSVRNSSGSPNSYLTYYMSSNAGCETGDLVTFGYEEPLGSKMTLRCGMRYKLSTPNDWSISGNKYAEAIAESVWVTSGTTQMQMNVAVEAKVQDVVLAVASGLVSDTGKNTYVQDDPRRFTRSFTFDPAAVH